jgi:hypothetical protein
VKELNIVVEGTTFNWRKVLKHPQGSCVAKEDFKLMKIKECSIKNTNTHNFKHGNCDVKKGL